MATFPTSEPADETPRVAVAGRSFATPLAIVGAAALGGLVFWQLTENRLRIEQERLTDPQPGALAASSQDIPPPPDISAFAAPAPVFVEATPPPAPLPAFTPPPPNVDRLKAPALVVDLSESGPPQAGATVPLGAGLTPGGVAAAVGAPARAAEALSNDERFAQRFGLGDENGPVKARRMGDQSQTIPEGAVIPGVLETAINSDLPGYVRAIVSRDVRSFDGKNVLAPRGSRLIGQYKAGVALGQSRAFVIWTRLVRPDGVTIDLAAPGADALGRGGLEGRVDRHFLRRFGGAILLSLITAGVSAAVDDSDTQVIIASTRGAGDAASVALSKEIDIPPTVSVDQGAPIRIFVTRDLDFSSVSATSE